uniref:Uncharacterized protein n=1 Tax=Octopus bimaculoides TaxID=37653 RepID=A0A0L8FZG9_OCTBM
MKVVSLKFKKNYIKTLFYLKKKTYFLHFSNTRYQKINPFVRNYLGQPCLYF